MDSKREPQADSKSTKTRSTKVFYIGDFRRPWYTANWVAYGLEAAGCHVRKEQEYPKDRNHLLKEIERYSPDFVLFAKLKSVTNPRELIKELRRRGIPTVCWLFDLYWELPLGVGDRTPFDPPFDADIVFTTDGGHDEQWDEIGVNHHLLRQGIHEPEHILYNEEPSGVVFVGTIYTKHRAKMHNFLKRTYGPLYKHYGRRMTGGSEVRGLELNRVLAQSKLVIGDSVPIPSYWSNRVYEMTGRGGVLIHPIVEGLDDEFVPYREYIPYMRGDYDELEEIINHYLDDDKRRENIRRAGFKRCGDYTYESRVEQLLATLVHEGLL